MKNTPLPDELSGEIVERLIRVDKSLLYLIAGALEFAVDREPYDVTGSLTVAEAREALGEMLWDFYTEEITPVSIIGEMKFLAFDGVPSGYLECDGSEVSRTTYAELFDAIGTTWGEGNGTTTFNIPDMRDKSPMGKSGTKALGDNLGTENRTLTVTNLPSHSHRMVGRNAAVLFHYMGVGGANATYNGVGNTNDTNALNSGTTGDGTEFSILHPVRVGKFVIYAGVV